MQATMKEQKETEQKVLAFVQSGVLYCRNCGKKEHRETAKFCIECGSELFRLKNYLP
jgi:rRNA maturation endonuclease Nob1